MPVEVEQITGSILDQDAIEKAMNGVDHVVHAAAIAHLWTPDLFDYDRVNVVGTCLMLAAARRAGASMVYVSSFTTLISDETPRDALLDESTEVVPSKLLGRYPRSKRQAELAVMSAAEAGQTVCIVLPGAPVGAGDYNLTPPTRMISDLIDGSTPALLECTLNLVDANAVAEAIVKALTLGESGARYLLTGDDVAMREVANKIARITGKAAPKYTVPISIALLAARTEALVAKITKKPPKAPLSGVRLAGRPCRFNNAKACRDLGFTPRPWEECVEESVAWLKGRRSPQG
jgi:dihydroflavonol-4-reductase